jgi:putative ABC transport system permease protein
MSTLTQVREIVLMNLRSIPQRLGASLVIVIGIGGVVGVLVAMLSMSAGLGKTLNATGDPERAVVLRGGSNGELASFLDRAAATLIRQDPAIARAQDGLPLASGEIIVVTEVPRRGDTSGANVSLRGVEPKGFELRPELRIVEGRRFKPGLRELIVGAGAYTQFEGLEVGRRLKFRGSYWTIVGRFESGDAHDSELWVDLETAQGAFGRSGVSSVLVRLGNRDAFDALKRRLESDPQLNVEVKTERDFFNAQSSGLTRQIGWITNIVAAIMAFGALFGALNTMYSAVSTRTAEIGTLRALGFGAAPVIASVMAEAMLLSLAGGALGAGVAWLLFNGYSVSTLGGNFTQIAFNFAVTPALVLQGLSWALIIGFLGGLFPALRAARLPVTAALRG